MKKIGAWLILVIVYFVVLANTVASDDYSAEIIAILYVFIPVIGIPMLIGAFSKLSREKSRKKEIEKILKTKNFISEFAVSKNNGIRLDTSNKNICLIINKYKMKSFSLNPSVEFETKIIPYSKILSSKIIEDGETITNATTKTTSMAGRALVGGLLFGGVGAIIGGVTAKGTSKTRNTIKKLEIEIILDDPSYPVHRVHFLDMDSGVDYDSFTGKQAREEICYWQILLEFIMMGEEIPKHHSVTELSDYAKMVKAKRERLEK